jgi:hypothetical protein
MGCTVAEQSTTFEAFVSGSETKTGIVVPEQAIAELNAGKRPPVHVNLNGYEYRSTVAVMGGNYLVGVNADVRAATGVKAGDKVRVTLTVADSPREVVVPDDLAARLSEDERARVFFAALSNSLQRYHVDTINAARTPATRQRRIDKAMALFREGKKR